ncbi:WecB/TagA/CpsF family glycosyltransferase [Hephaestia mangrovi]|uniref:WecB/TagA/CpsF family glycosyltransferase n=1 Tax=Hephaestia mangrovi TaxID=2873268 RepID=UPI001CA782E0|nr:WecB/TagA/CpsF family glycosyltransferase [Hephaestia mangrovi]MBY8829933.1 WecB/TagA/CpsF family glycosyltransferase [Hephaestia mangrovi]
MAHSHRISGSVASDQAYGIPFTRASFEQIVAFGLRAAERPTLFVTCNLNHLRLLQTNAAFREAYRKAAIITLDSRPMQALARIQLRQSFPLVTGADLFEALIEQLRPERDRPFFVAGSEFAATQLTGALVARGFANSAVGHIVPPFGFEWDSAYGDRLIEQIGVFAPTHLFMGVGAPKSEIWISRRFDSLPPANIFCVGAALDFTAGLKERAPPWFRKSGLEWLHRLAGEPRRLFPRYAGDAFLLARMIAGRPLAQIGASDVVKPTNSSHGGEQR